MTLALHMHRDINILGVCAWVWSSIINADEWVVSSYFGRRPINVCWVEQEGGPLIPSGEKPRTLGIRDPQCDHKRSVAQNKTHGYHIDVELCDRSRD